MKLAPSQVREYLRSSLWFIPAICVAGAFALAQALLAADEAISQERDSWFLFGGGPDSARSLLSTIAASMITFTGVVFSITMLVLQLASQQFSPRVLRTFLRDRANQTVLGVFVGTLTYALLALRRVRSESEVASVSAFVPSLSIWVALLLVLTCLGLFVYYIHHMAQSIRAVTIIDRVAQETRRAIDHMYPEEVGDEPEEPAQWPPARPSLIIPSPGPPGVLVSVDEERLMEIAGPADRMLALAPMMGDFVPEGAPLLRVWGAAAGVDPDAAAQAMRLGQERSMDQDPAFGFRQLVDIAERALSPSTNDPTTAVQALDQLHDLLRRLSGRRFPSPVRVDGSGRPCLILPRPSWEDYVLLALDEVRQYGEESIQVLRRLRAAIEDLRMVAPPHRRPPLERQLALLDRAVARGFDDPGDQLLARRPSLQGHGPATTPRRLATGEDQEGDRS